MSSLFGCYEDGSAIIIKVELALPSASMRSLGATSELLIIGGGLIEAFIPLIPRAL